MSQNGAVFMDVMNKGGGEYRARLAEMRADGSLLGDQFDGAGFVRGIFIAVVSLLILRTGWDALRL